MPTVKQEPPSLAGASAGLKEYLKRAFFYRWNALLFFGGVTAAALSPWPDALLPLIAALESAYLGGVIASPRFRKAIDAQAYQEKRAQPQGPGQPRSIEGIVDSLPLAARHRFHQVRSRCLEMRAIAQGVRGRTTAAAEPGEDLSTPALDRLLWVFLRLLVSEEALARFLDRTNPNEIRTRLEEAKARLAAQAGAEDRITRSIVDSVAAQELRLENYERGRKNLEFVRVELDRIEAKIQVLTESSVNRQDPDFLSGQIDSVTASMQSTEKAITELQEITGLVDELQEPPAILEADLGKVAGS